ncbi:hypothetical protein TBR22_A23290 [Luteitalea sp. TBR-22]|uniref:DUF1624 domain-containing protein n=1 Tax=Luteitalea sp. TBR-22 TaxID=2802971 RepID=UPI001AF86084|nr:heparan-alpha-glucosaminide N-acetyltransferase domain-containing protein [Luteitalea sp. TBR-22]BCS33103.1 hypothetical protein TBR22_A23290 [Luteitalea sp. TBR-22]
MSSASSSRLAALDALRGLVIVLMAIDHARDFFHAGAMTGVPTDLATTTPLLFATRWITHLCAPVFAWAAGAGAWLRLQRPGQSPGALARYLVWRGLGLIVLEVTVMRVAMTFSLSPTWPVLLLVLWMLGVSMMALAALQYLPLRLLLWGSLAVIALHHLADGIRPEALGAWAGLWRVLHVPGVITPGGVVAVVGYPLVPWVAVMAAGFAMAPIFTWAPEVRRRWLLAGGLIGVLGFVVLRTLNVYGDPSPWARQPSAVMTLVSFLNTTKYPPSLAFLLMTLGPAAWLLAWLDRRALRPSHPFLVFGRVPLFFYVTHFFLLHALAVAAAWWTYGGAAWSFAWMPLPSMGGPAAAFPPGFGYALPITYVAWAAVVGLLYPACRWWGRRDVPRTRG